MDIASAGILPDHDPSGLDAHESLSTDYSCFKTYSGVEDDDTAQKEIRSHLELGRLKAFDSVEEPEREIGAKPVLNKIGIISRMKDGKCKKRMILDTSASSVKEATQ